MLLPPELYAHIFHYINDAPTYVAFMSLTRTARDVGERLKPRKLPHFTKLVRNREPNSHNEEKYYILPNGTRHGPYIKIRYWYYLPKDRSYQYEEKNYYLGLLNGVWEQWYGNVVDECFVKKQIVSRLEIKIDENHGVAEHWFDNGTLKSQEEYKNGRRHGICRTWHENGQMQYETYYENGKIVTDKEWDCNGNSIK